MTQDSDRQNHSHRLNEFFFLRHGARLDQLDATWRASSPTPYDTPISRHGADQARLTGQSIALHSSASTASVTTSLQTSDGRRRRRPPRYIIHTSPFLRCIQTSLALAAMLDADAAVTGRLRTQLRLECWLGEWMTPDYYTDISPPPPMPELASHALSWLRQLSKSPPTTPDDSLMQQFKSLHMTLHEHENSGTNGHGSLTKVNGSKGAADKRFTASPAQEADVALGAVKVDWKWSTTAFGEGGEYGEEWPEMHARFRSSLRQLLDYYACPSSRPDIQSTNDGTGEEEVIVILVTHGAGCNAMMGAVSGRPVLTDVGIASLSHAILRPSLPMRSERSEYRPSSSSGTEIDDRQKRRVSDDYCLLMSASTQHLTSPLDSSLHSNSNNFANSSNGGGQSTIGRSGSWHNNLGRSSRPTSGLWSSTTSSRRESRHVSTASTSVVPELKLSETIIVADAQGHEDENRTQSSLDPRAVTRQRGRQRSFTVQI